MADAKVKSIRLLDGLEVIVRPMKRSDEPRMLDFFRSLPKEDRQFLRHDVTQPENVHRFVTDVHRDTVLALVGELDGRIVASATLQRHHYGWTTHVGEIRVVIARSLQRKGLGVALVRMLVKAAIAEGVEKMIAEVASNRTGARKAFERLGFVREAVLKRHVKDLSGRKRDLVIYATDVSHIWDRMESMVSDFNPTLGG
jgi:RimJ/RimL family protein N-acetyltransferase